MRACVHGLSGAFEVCGLSGECVSGVSGVC